MVCYGSCMFASVFLIANIYTIFSCTNDNNKMEFKNTLTHEQQELYEKIDLLFIQFINTYIYQKKNLKTNL